MSFDPTLRERENPDRRIRRRSHRFIAIIVMVVGAGFILKEQIPAVDTYIDRLLKPQAWQATEACRQAVLAAVERPEFARMLEHGEANATQKGYYVDDIVVGEMGASGTEVRVRFSCYVDGEGKVVNTQRQS
jgi:NaMN:DMB phosphoribosyltransferase